MFSKKITVSKPEIAEFQRVFNIFDKRFTREVSIRNLGSMMKILKQNFTESYIKRLASELDRQKRGRFTFQDFLKIVVPKMTTKEALSELREVFKILDTRNKGYIAEEDLAHAMGVLGIDNSKDRVREILKESDLDGDGKVNFDDFFKIMTTK